jgi:predicted ArsR family transcriptional regulator
LTNTGGIGYDAIMQETRQRLVEILRIRGPQTVEDLVRAMKLTRTAVTTHLASLQAEGFVARQGLRAGRRRPSVTYALTPAADALFPKAYEEFASMILAEIKRGGAGNTRRLLRRIADDWIRRDLPRVEGTAGKERLERVRSILGERGFLPALERTREGYMLRESNCPLMRLAFEHVEVCDMVHRWLEALAGVPLKRIQCLRQGDPFSAYTVAAAPGARAT